MWRGQYISAGVRRQQTHLFEVSTHPLTVRADKFVVYSINLATRRSGGDGAMNKKPMRRLRLRLHPPD
jgi:hypothetical protein